MGHIRAKQNVFLSQVQILIHSLITVKDLKKFEENEVEWAGKAETR